MAIINKSSDSGSSISISSLADIGSGLDNVGVHTSAPLAIGKKVSIGAYSYASGNDVGFSKAPGGKNLIGHELTHSVQQLPGK